MYGYDHVVTKPRVHLTLPDRERNSNNINCTVFFFQILRSFTYFSLLLANFFYFLSLMTKSNF